MRYSLLPFFLLACSIQAVFADNQNSLSLYLTNAKSEIESMDNGLKISYQHRFNESVSFELANGKYGESDDGYESKEYGATNLAVIFNSNRDEAIWLTAKLGLSHWEITEKSEFWGAETFSGNDVLYGVGVQLQPAHSVLLSVEYEYLNIHGYALKSINAGVGFQF